MIHVIINPVAGNGRAARVGEEIVALLSARGVAHIAQNTQSPGHATALAEAAVAQGAETALAVGGDGTVLEVARGLAGTKTALGVIPAGTGNDVIKMLNVPGKTPLEALDFVLKTPPRPLDAGLAGSKLFLNICGMGFDVNVLEYALTAKRYVHGMLPYLWGVVRTILSGRPVRAMVSPDGEPPALRNLLIFAIANGRFFGGGMEIAPLAVPDDGLLDIVMIDAMPRGRMVLQLPKLVSGRVMEIPGLTHIRCRRAAVTLPEAGGDLRINIDGEIVPMPDAVFEIQPGALLAHW